MNANKFVVVIAFFVAASLGFAQGMRGTGGGGMAGQPIDGTAISPSSVTVSGNTSTQTLNVGTTSTTIRSHMLCEETIYTPSDFNTKHAVFGRNATSGASSGGVWLSYHTGDNEGIIGSLSPGTAWRPLAVAAQTLKMRPAGGAATVTLGNGVTSTGAIEGSTHNATIASGSQAYTCTNTGCRLSLGNTARYLVDDGTNLEFIAPVQATTFEATTASGSSLTGGGASGTLLITSNTPDSLTGVNGPATITMQASQALTAGDQVFRVLTSTGTQAFAVRTNGSLVAGESTGQGVVNFRQWNSQQSAPTEWINDAALTEKNPVRITHVKDVVADDASLLSIYDNLTNRVMTVSKDGLLRVNASNAAKPTCNADNRGRVYFLDGAAGVADTYEVCGKSAADTYSWKTIVTF